MFQINKYNILYLDATLILTMPEKIINNNNTLSLSLSALCILDNFFSSFPFNDCKKAFEHS